MILHLNNAKTWRGGEQQLAYLVLGLKQKKIPQLVIGQPNSELQKRIADKVEFIPLKTRGEYDIFAAYEIYKICKERGVKLIHTHTGGSHGIGLLVKYFWKDVFLLVSRRVDFHINQNFFSKRKYLSDKVDYFLCVSDRIKEVLLEDGIHPEKLITVHSGIDLDKFKNYKLQKNIREELGVSKDTILIGNVAALVDHKDQKTLLRAISKMESKKKYKVLILGAGELENELKSLSKELNLEDKVFFLGFKPNILDYYFSFDIFVMSSKEEGLGTAILDAMAVGLPIASTSGGGISEILGTRVGSFLVNVGDSNSLAKSLDNLVEDKKRRELFGKKNKIEVKKFSVENTIQKTYEIYLSLLGTLE
jgi:glycosyltransferase involved in cell wall biosynthesis